MADARDFAAYLYRIVFKKQFNDLWNWIGLALTLVGLVPLVGDIAKYLGKSASKGKLSELVKNADGVWSYIRSLAPGKFENIARLKGLLAENWGKGVKDAKDIWNAALSQLLNLANGIPDLFFSQQKRQLIEVIQQVSRESNKMLPQAFDRIWEDINRALDEIGRALNPNGELVTPEGVRLPSDEGINSSVLNQSSGSGGAGRTPNTQSIRINEQGRINTLDKEASGAIQVSALELKALKTIDKTDYQSLIANLGHENVLTLIQRLDGVWFTRIYTQGGGEDALKVILEIIDLEAKGKVNGFNDWLKFARDSNKQGNDLINVVAELTEAKRLAADVKADEVINVGGDAQVVPRRDGSTPQSYDITVVDRQGQVRRNIDVTSIQNVVTEASDFTDGIRHAIEKVGEAKGIKQGATVEATIQVEMPQRGYVATLQNNREKHFGENGRYTITDPGGTPRASVQY